MSKKQELVNHVVELMSDGFAPVTAKAMFGGHGIYWHELMFALIANEQLYIKADEQSVEAFTARGLKPFTYASKGGKSTSLRYFEAPPEVMDDPAQMGEWARLGHDCALRQQKGKKPKKR
ncbi:MAG: TfoX family protein [Rubrivivax sp.]|nr:MAG: TfoX family protein [Rubrivivax sp.]